VIEECCGGGAQSSGDQVQIAQRHVSFAALDPADVRSVETAAMSEFLLGPAKFQATRADGSAENPNHIHEFGRVSAA
jgi:hypothetical protein